MRSSSSRLNFQRQQLSPSPSSNEQQNGGGGGESNYNRQRLNNNVGGGGGGEMEKFLAMQILQAILFTTRFVFPGKIPNNKKPKQQPKSQSIFIDSLFFN